MKKSIALFLCVMLVLCPLAVAAAPAADAPVMDGKKLVTFGDSITALSTWPYTVAEQLNTYLVNSGIGGNTTAHGKARFERDVLAHDPDFVIISFGSNDFYLEDGTNPRVSTTDYKANLTYFIEQLEAIDAVPVLMTPPFLREDTQGGADLYPEKSVNAALDKYVVAMREVASETGTHLVDMHAVCDSGNYDLATFLIEDGLHLADQGNQVYTDTIVGYMQDNFNQDPTAPRVETYTAPPADPGAWTKSLVPFELDKWLNIYPDELYGIEEPDGTISFANTTGKWPEIHYSPAITDAITVPVKGSYLTVDLELDAATNIMLFFNGPNPTLTYANTYIKLADILTQANSGITVSGDDILGHQDFRVNINLEDFIPADYIAEDGTVVVSGTKVFAIGEAHTKVTINELSVTTTDDATPKTPFYEDQASLLPTTNAEISANAGVASHTINTDGSLTLTRADDGSDIAWPSVKVTCGKQIDLHATPYLHLKMTTPGGYANGILYYTDAYGNSNSVQLSYTADGTANDFTSDIDMYVDLSAAVRSGGTITLDSYILSVYGVTGASLTWNTIATAKEAPDLPGDVNRDNTVSTSDCSAILRYLVNNASLSADAVELADYNGDGKVTTMDVRQILQMLANS